MVRVLCELDRVASRGLIVADLLRRRRAYGWITLLTAFSHPIIRHDARASVAQAMRRDEVISLRDRAGLSYLNYAAHRAHRFCLAGEKAEAVSNTSTRQT